MFIPPNQIKKIYRKFIYLPIFHLISDSIFERLAADAEKNSSQFLESKMWKYLQCIRHFLTVGESLCQLTSKKFSVSQICIQEFLY